MSSHWIFLRFMIDQMYETKIFKGTEGGHGALPGEGQPLLRRQQESDQRVL